MIVKICGITSAADARAAVEAGANALGFNFYERSPRYLSPQTAATIIDETPGDYLRVGVFVNATCEELQQAASAAHLDVLQLHGTSPGSLPAGFRLWRAVAASEAPNQPDPAFEAYLLDAPSAQYGGSGLTFDWSLAAHFPGRAIVAGGLEPANVAQAIAATQPWGVDACSRLECAPGRKDHARVQAFVRNALAAQNRTSTKEMIVTV